MTASTLQTSLRILHIYKDYFPVLGGIENHLRTLAEAQAAAGHQVTVLVCAPDGHTQVTRDNGVCLIKASRLATVASMPLSLRQPLVIARLRPDIAHIHAPYPLGEVANWLWGRARATVITYHSDIVRQQGWLRLYAPLLRRVLRAANAIIATSPSYLATSPWLQPLQERCTVVPLGIDLARFSVAKGRMEQPQPFLLFVGKLRYYKGLDVLLQALTTLPQAQLVVVGDGPMRGTWQALAQTLGLAGRVTFVSEVAETTLLAYYAAAALLVLPSTSRAEAFGTVLLEAMAAGLPVISTAVATGTSWVNQDGVTGYVVPANNVEALAHAIRLLLSDAARRQRMGAAARERVAAAFTLTTMARQVATVYTQALDHARRGRTSA
jgi:rhamnosyl/mannosyltransferase